MAEQSKKPRNIKDLKARLGRTITPGQQGQGQGQAPGQAQGQPQAQGPSPGPTQPPKVGGGIVPPPGGGLPGPSSAAPPPAFMQPKPAAKPADPFGAPAQAAQADQQVRLVIDDKPVEESEVGRRRRTMTIVLAAVGSVVGLGLGVALGSTAGENKTYNLAVRDGKDIYERVREASETVDEASRYLDEAVKAAKGGPGKGPAVDYQALTKLRALEKPFSAGDFARRKYGAFQTGTVDALFEYYNNVNLLWEKFQGLASQALPEQRRERLEEAVKAAGEMASSQTGCVLAEVEGQLFCGLVYLHKPQNPDGPIESVQVSSTPRGRTYEKKIYAGQDDLLDNPDNYVILTHTQRSVGVLGQSANLFAEYQRDLLSAKQLMDSTLETQGTLEKGLGEVASLEERFTLF